MAANKTAVANGDSDDEESDSDNDSDEDEQKESTELSLSTDHGVAAFASGSPAELALAKGVRWSTLGVGQHVRGTVERIASNGVWVAVKTSEGGARGGMVEASCVCVPVLSAHFEFRIPKPFTHS